MIKYPCRCRIINVTDQEWHGLNLITPEESKQYIGMVGTAYQEDEFYIRIELDNGKVIYGYDCWWEPIE